MRKHHLYPWFCSLALLGACGEPQSDDFGEEQQSSEQSSIDDHLVASQDQRRVVDNGDGTWSYADRWTTVDEQDDGEFVWAYIGQSHYPNEPKVADRYSFTMKDERPLPLAARMIGQRRFSHGEIWEVVDVHEERLDPELVAYANAQVRDFKPLPPDEVGTVVQWEPESWDNEDCNGVGGNEVHVWDGESRNRKSGPSFTARQQTAVFISTPGWSPEYTCSGVLLRDDWVLSAAHCFLDINEDLLYPESRWSVRNVHGESVGVDQIHVASGYNRTGINKDFEDDWVLVELDSAHPTTPSGDMDIYGGDDDAYKDIDDNVHLLGYPSYVLSAGGSCIAGDEDLFHMSDADVTSEASGRLRFKSDGAPQQSGAPYYFCPDGADDVCGPGEEGRVIGVHVGFNPVNNRYVAPKATAFRAEALAIMP